MRLWGNRAPNKVHACQFQSGLVNCPQKKKEKLAFLGKESDFQWKNGVNVAKAQENTRQIRDFSEKNDFIEVFPSFNEDNLARHKP